MQRQAMSKEAVAELRLPVAQQRDQTSWRWGQSESLLTQTLQRLKRSKTAIFGLAIVSLLLMVSIFADVLAPYSPIHNAPDETFQHPNRKHVLGTDQFGRDMLSRIIHGSRIS